VKNALENVHLTAYDEILQRSIKVDDGGSRGLISRDECASIDADAHRRIVEQRRRV